MVTSDLKNWKHDPSEKRKGGKCPTYCRKRTKSSAERPSGANFADLGYAQTSTPRSVAKSIALQPGREEKELNRIVWVSKQTSS